MLVKHDGLVFSSVRLITFMKQLIQTTQTGVFLVPKRAAVEEEQEAGNVEYGLRLAKLRKLAGLSQQELGDRIGVAQPIISRFEKGQRKMYDDMLAMLAKALGVTPNDILGIGPCKTIKPEEASLSRRLVLNMKKIESLPRRAQDKVITSLELALKGAIDSRN
jgi:transcriptional regulator with XRE-family HTH domain